MSEPNRKLVDSEDRRISAIERDVSIELAPEQARTFNPAPHLLPSGSRVFLTHLEGKPTAIQVEAARRLKETGFVPVPHIGARHFASERDFLDLLRAHSANGITEALVVGGNPSSARGPFFDAAALLEHPAFADSTIRTVFLGGYPEGHPAIAGPTLNAELNRKIALCLERKLEPRLVSQFAFDGKAISTWAADVGRTHPGLPVHVGLAGVTSITKLIRFGMICGVGPSLAVLRRSPAGMFNVLADKDPGEVLDTAESHYPAHLLPFNLHFYPFGGWERTLAWVHERRLTLRTRDACP